MPMVKSLIKKFNDLGISNSKVIFFGILFVVILIQLVLVSIIFFQNKELKLISQRVDYNVMAMREQRDTMSAKIDSLQNSMMRVLSQLYRMQGEGE